MTLSHAAPTTPDQFPSEIRRGLNTPTDHRMKKFSRRLTKAAPLALLGFLFDSSMLTQPAHALVGGPFDNGAFPGATADGTYSGTITGHNLIGIVTFGVSSNSETNGRFSIFHEGFVNYGAATGVADLSNRTVAGSLLGVALVDGSGQSTVNGGSNVNTTVTGTGTVTAGTGTLTVRSGVEGAFIAKMKGYPQQITFEGDGRLSSSANTAVVVLPALDANGAIDQYLVNFPTNASPQTQTDNPTKDSNNAGTGGNLVAVAQGQAAVLRTETNFKIRGSRTSNIIYTALNNYTGVTQTITSGTPAQTTPVAATPTPTPAP